MPYGVKRGYKAPGDFGAGDILGLGLAGSAGIVSALVTDYQQSGEASALFTINRWVVMLGDLLGFADVPLWAVVLGLTAVGALSIFYFQPITRQGAFAQGFGLLAVMMTAVPADLASGIESVPGMDDLPGLSSSEREASAARVIPASYTQARVTEVQARRRQADKYDVDIVVRFTAGMPDNIETLIRTGALRGRLHNEDTDETWNLFRSAGGQIRQRGDTLRIRAGVPARSATARLWVRIEAMGYEIQEESAQARLGETLTWTVELAPSSTPLFLQRFRKSYWF